jgi:hypothetical protein
MQARDEPALADIRQRHPDVDKRAQSNPRGIAPVGAWRPA